MQSINQLKKFNHDDYSEICEQLACRDTALDLVDITIAPHTLLLKFFQEKFYHEATQLLAYGLPNREAIWWGYLCAQHAAVDKPAENKPDKTVQQALDLTQQWVINPNEPTRREIKTLADNLEYKTPTGWIAIAVFWSGDNIAPLEQPAIMPEKYKAKTAVVNAINQSALHDTHLEKNYLRYIKQGVHIANGGNGAIQ